MTIPQINFREPKTLVRVGLGVLLFANVVAAVMAFHLVGDSPADLESQLAGDRAGLAGAQQRLNKSKVLLHNVELSREQGNSFLTAYMADRRHYVSTTDSELNKLAETAGMKAGDLNYSLLDPIEGADDLETLTITANFDGGYGQLMKFVNMLDRSPRFLIIDTLQVAPQPKGDILSATFKINTFVKDAQVAAQ